MSNTMAPQPWTPEKRSQVKRKIDKEAARAAARLGAKTVVIVAFFQDGNCMHMQDGGSAPMPFDKLYKQLSLAMTILDQSGGEDVRLQ
jgi:hypothetical protein